MGNLLGYEQIKINCSCCKNDDEDHISKFNGEKKYLPFGSNYIKQIGENFSLEFKPCSDNISSSKMNLSQKVIYYSFIIRNMCLKMVILFVLF